ncbi:hypothetical protein [Nitratifractor sp.]
MLLLVFSWAGFAGYLYNDHILSPKASDIIEKIGLELYQKTGISEYAIVTNESLGRGVSLYDYVKNEHPDLKRPYAVLILAPNSKRIGIVVSDPSLKNMYDDDRVKGYAIRIIGSPDKNTMQSKYDVGVVQAYSELADEIAASKGVKLNNTIKDEGRWLIDAITWLVYLGSVVIFWIYFGRPLIRRIRNG